MKHLKTYKLFESVLYLIPISDTLQDIFDEYNIPFLHDHTNMSDEERWSKFWDYSSDRPFGENSQINIMNIKTLWRR